VTLKPGLAVTKGHQKTNESGTHDLLITFHSHYRPISHRFRDIGHFRRKSPIFPYPRVYITPDEGFPLEFGIGVRGPKCLNGSYVLYHMATFPMTLTRDSIGLPDG